MCTLRGRIGELALGAGASPHNLQTQKKIRLRKFFVKFSRKNFKKNFEKKFFKNFSSRAIAENPGSAPWFQILLAEQCQHL